MGYFLILGVVVQVGTQQSLSLLRKVFPVGNYIAASLALLFLQSTSLILFNESYYFAYSLFIFNLTFLGWLTTHTIKSLDRTYIIDLIATKYFNV